MNKQVKYLFNAFSVNAKHMKWEEYIFKIWMVFFLQVVYFSKVMK